jgi:purine-binding chemotaxis protein CheW
MIERSSYCTFYLDRLLVGIAVDRVAEVLRDEIITPVPLAHPDVAGLLNLRGQIVTAIDGRRRLGLSQRAGAETPTVVVIRSGGEAVSLLVDRASDVVEVEDYRLEEVPETVGSSISALVLGVHQLEGNLLLLVLDPDLTLAVTS